MSHPTDRRLTHRTLAVVGCATNRTPVGLHVFDVSGPGGGPRLVSTFDHIDHPSMSVVHPTLPVLYSVSETADGEVVASTIAPDGTLRELDRVSSLGAAPCHLSVDRNAVYVANYGSGTVAARRLGDDGRFGELVGSHQHVGHGPHDRQDGPHAHCIVPGPGGGTVHAVDLGTDRIHRYRSAGHSDTSAFTHLGDTFLEPGSGPRHLTFHPHEPVAFVVGELDSTVTVLAVDPVDGATSRLGSVSTLPDTFDGASLAAEIAVHPDGRWVFVSNRGHDSIAVFDFDDVERRLIPVGHTPSGGRHPRHFALHPSGDSMLVANRHDDRLVHFEIDRRHGGLTRTGSGTTVSEPVAVTYVEIAR